MLSIVIMQTNAAFENSDTETARILRELAGKVSEGCVGCTVRDIKGNPVGTMVTLDED